MKRYFQTILYLLAALSLAAAAAQGYALYRLESLQNALAHPDTLRVDADAPAALIFAKAEWHARKGQADEAMKLYSSLRATPDLELRARVFHNLGALYLRDGAARWNARGVLDYARVLTLVELAKENYREALRLDPEDWDARHDLEYAWRITPPPKEKPKSDFKGRKSSVFATLPGIPGGGP
jgi:mxaK protein